MWLNGANGGATFWGELGGSSQTVQLMADRPNVQSDTIGNALSELGNLALEEVRRNSGESKWKFYGRFAKDWLKRNPLIAALLYSVGIGLIVFLAWLIKKLCTRKKKGSNKNRW